MRTSMIAWVATVLFATVSNAADYDQCDNVVEFENGEKAGKFTWVGYYQTHALAAQNLCGIDIAEVGNRMAAKITELGCHAGTEIHDDAVWHFAELEKISLIDMLKKKPQEILTASQIETRSAKMKSFLEQSLGMNCTKLAAWVADMFEKQGTAKQ